LKLNVPVQLGLWGDDPYEDPASAVTAVSHFPDPLTASVSPLAAPPLQSTVSSSATEVALRGAGVPLPDDEPLPSVHTLLRAPSGQPHYECHPVSGLPWFRHPMAEREIRFGKAMVSYEIKRVRRRSIGMVVGVDGLSVRAPRWVSPTDIETALRAKERWICAKLVEQRDRAHKQLSARIDWREGATVPYMGESVVLVLDPRISGAVLQHADRAGDPALPGVAQRTLHIGLPHHATSEQIRDAVQSWLQREALEIFVARVAHYAAQLDVAVTRVRLSQAKTRWGSASVDGSIRLHWRLVHFSLSIIDYVVAHELAHLREMNHSPRFWEVVRSVMPDFDGPKDQLRHVVIPD
jgi:predicted metal-dependent hydrolase